MPRVDFYVLPDAAPESRMRLACRLAEKAYLRGHTVYIHAESPEQARSVDELLWTFRDGSFVPHERLPCPDPEAPVRVGTDPGGDAEVLINLAGMTPAPTEAWERVIELVDQAPESLRRSRERFRRYREQGLDPQSHRL